MSGAIYRNNDMATAISVTMTETKRMPTSISIKRELWDEIKILAIREQTTATELVEEGMRDLIAKKAKARSSSKK